MKKILLYLLLATLFSCQKTEYPTFPEGNAIIGLATPLQLEPGGNDVFLVDYFPDPTVIDSVYFNGKKLNLSSNNIKTYTRAPQKGNPVMEMQVWVDDFPWSVPVYNARKVLTTFTYDPGNKEHHSVSLSGEFNGWTPSRTPMQFRDGRWQASMYLNPGTYAYQVVADGESMTDPGNPEKMGNNFGGFNSILRVGGNAQDSVPFLYTKEIEKGRVEIGSHRPVNEYRVYWQNFRLDPVFLEAEDDGLEITIPEQATQMKRSYLRVYAYNAHGMSNDLLIPLDLGKAVENQGQLERTDYHNAIIYNVFVDRFYDGDPANNRPLNSLEVLPPADFFGGDIRGVTEKIEEGYFSGLGVNTLWISPIIQNPQGAYGYWKDPVSKFSAYHGYWPISFTKIDERFATPATFHEMIRTAHSQGLNILLDFVANHVHQEHPFYQENPDKVTNLYLPDGRENTQLWDEQRLTTWFDTFLPSLDLESPAVTNMLVDSAIWWLQTYDLDGFRHDATKHIPEIFWRTLTKRVKQQVMVPNGKNIYQIGETYGSGELISSYVGTGMLDAQFDFNVYDAAVGVFAREADPFTRLDQVLHESFGYYGHHNLMGYITGNQDRARFISYAGGSLGFEEDAKWVGWNREVDAGDPISYQRLSMLMAFNMTIPGIPVIFYGDEFGMPGGNDPDSRRMMRFDGLSKRERTMLETTKKLVALRNNSLALTYGDLFTLLVDEKSYVYARKYFEEVQVMLFNKSDEATTLVVEIPEWMDVDGLTANFGHDVQLKKNEMTVTLPAWSFEILSGTE